MTGPKSEEFARCSAYVLNYYFNVHLDLPAQVINFQIRNIVSHFNLGYEIDLKGLQEEIGSRAMFVPDKIHCCRIRKSTKEEEWEQVCLVFMSGAVVITGAKNREDIKILYEENAAICSRHKNNGKFTKDDYRQMYRNNDPKQLQDLNRKLNNMTKESRGLLMSGSIIPLKEIIKEMTLDISCDSVPSNPLIDVFKNQLLMLQE